MRRRFVIPSQDMNTLESRLRHNLSRHDFQDYIKRERETERERTQRAEALNKELLLVRRMNAFIGIRINI